MKTHHLQTSMRLPIAPEEVFPLFGDVINLQRITPPGLDFRILTPLPIDIRKGAIVDYRFKLLGFLFKWHSEITVWEPPHSFLDMQVWQLTVVGAPPPFLRGVWRNGDLRQRSVPAAFVAFW